MRAWRGIASLPSSTSFARDFVALFPGDTFCRELASSCHEGFEIAVITGNAKRIVARFIGETNEVVGGLAQRYEPTASNVAKHARPVAAILGAR